jgi:hypothetical protein
MPFVYLVILIIAFAGLPGIAQAPFEGFLQKCWRLVYVASNMAHDSVASIGSWSGGLVEMGEMGGTEVQSGACFGEATKGFGGQSDSIPTLESFQGSCDGWMRRGVGGSDERRRVETAVCSLQQKRCRCVYV